MKDLTQKRITKALSKFGLSEKEQVIYLEILKHEESSPYTLSKQTGIPRTTVYDILLNLSLKKLIILKQSDGIQKQQTKVKAKNPSILREILRNRKTEIEETDVDITEILPLLKNTFQPTEAGADFQFLPGLEGVKKVYYQLHEANEESLVFENMMPMDSGGVEAMNDITDKETNRIVRDKKMHRELIPLTDWTKHVISYQQARNKDYVISRNLRYVDSPLFTNDLSITIQGKRCFFSCAHKEETWAMIITSQALVKFFTSIFEIQWQNAVPVTIGMVESWGSNYFYDIENKKNK